jgi:uncharacterized protein
MIKMLMKKNENRGRYINTGYGASFQPVDIGHPDYTAVVNPDNAFWTLVRHEELSSLLCDEAFLSAYRKKADEFNKEMTTLRFGLKPSTVYFNPTERCNLNCEYCYIPDEMRKNGPHMDKEQLFSALEKLKTYFKSTVPEGRKPSIIFHGSEPMMNREVMFAGIEKFKDDFNFGIQTNATLLDDEAIEFIKTNQIGIGISIDGPVAKVADRARVDWEGKGYFEQVSKVIDKLKDHSGFNVICTVTTENMKYLVPTVDFFHANGVKVCMLNIIRCTRERARNIKPDDLAAAEYYLAALDRTYELYRQTGRKLVVANFTNILLGIVAPSARNLMCDISPCGGGRCFFAVSAKGDIFPCSEFVGVPEFNGGNIYQDNIQEVLDGEIFKPMVTRMVEKIEPCRNCAIRHFCGSPCPAEAFTMNGGMDQPGAFCEFYEEQVRYALRLIADHKEDAFMFDDWDKDIATVFDATKIVSV